MTEIVLGIDLGTTNSVASVWDGKTYKIIKNHDSDYFPSVIEFCKEGKKISNLNYDVNNSILNIKRLIGCNIENINLFKLFLDTNFDYEIIDDTINFYNKYEDKYYKIEELNSLILKNIVNSAKKQLNTDNIKDIVITIPAHFNQNQRDSVIFSSKLAKLNCLRIINEPVSAALTYGLTYHNDVNVLIFDLGGGTFDLSLLNIDEGIYEVIDTEGNNYLGGEDFTNIIVKDVISNFKDCNKYYKLNDSIINKKLSILKNECNKFKCNNIDKILLKEFYYDYDNNIILDLIYEKKRNQINNLFLPLLNKIREHLDLLINKNNIHVDDINYIILVGGSTKLMEVKNLVSDYFKKDPICTINPELVVSIGASIQGFILQNPENEFSRNLALVDILPLSIGVETSNGEMTKIIDKGSKIPCKRFKYFTNEEDNQQEINIKIYQGERLLIKDNILIGEFKLNNLKMKEKGKNIIKIEVEVNNNCMIKVSAFEKWSNNYKKIEINTENLYNEDLIRQLIEESEKYDKIDSLKIKLKNVNNKLNNQINNLEYNCYRNKYIKINEEDRKILEGYISKVKEKANKLHETLDKVQDNNNYNDIILNFKKLIKINNKKYDFLANNYDNIKYNNTTNDEFNDINNNKYNYQVKDYISKKLNFAESNKFSKYTKKEIKNYLSNIIIRINSINLDIDDVSEYIEDINNNLEQYSQNDIHLINKYGDLNLINDINKKHSINLNFNEIQNMSKLQIFDLIFEICIKYEIVLN